MKYQTIINKEREEVLIYCKEKNDLVLEIEKLIESNNMSINGINDNEKIQFNPLDVSCFVSENNKVYALINGERYQIKERLYQLEELLKDHYVKINQSCLANIKRISKFSSSIGGAVLVHFDNGYKDYISRRELKNVKERMGI